MKSIQACIEGKTKKGLSIDKAREKCESKARTKEFVNPSDKSKGFFGRELVTIRPFGREIVIGTPHRIEIVLLVAFIFALFQFDVVQNKVIDLGVDYSVTWFSNVQSRALDLAIMDFVVAHIILVLLFVLSLDISNRRSDTHHMWDILIGSMVLFGMSILLSGFINSIYSDTIRFLFINMKSISYYHIGVFFEVIGAFYYAFTK
jgi:hypothetical protein